MKQCYPLLCFVFFLQLALANPNKGYVITKNGVHLTGSIRQVFQSNLASEVIFTNDLGTTYSYRPELISGFVFQENTELIQYESKFDREKWVFFKVLEKGLGINLYKSPEDKVKVYMQDGIVDSYSYKSEEYWIEVKNRHPIRINRLNFRKKMRRVLRNLAPDIETKIGSPGYRFKDLQKIVEECNKQFRPGSKLI